MRPSGADRVEVGVSVNRHQQVGFGQYRRQHMCSAARSSDREAVGVGAADTYCGCAQRYRLHHVGPRPDPAVEQHRGRSRARDDIG